MQEEPINIPVSGLTTRNYKVYHIKTLRYSEEELEKYKCKQEYHYYDFLYNGYHDFIGFNSNTTVGDIRKITGKDKEHIWILISEREEYYLPLGPEYKDTLIVSFPISIAVISDETNLLELFREKWKNILLEGDDANKILAYLDIISYCPSNNIEKKIENNKAKTKEMVKKTKWL